MPESLDSIYITHWSLRDPLCQSQSLPYLSGLARAGTRVGLITFEQEPWRLGAAEATAAAAVLREEGILWRPLNYHRRPPVVSTLLDAIHGTAVARRWARSAGARLLHGRSLVPGAIAWGAAIGSQRRFFYDADGPLADEYAEVGVWRSGSLVHRAASAADRALFRNADRAAVLTQHRAREIEHLTSSSPAVLPCAVDTAHFQPMPERGSELRARFGLRGTAFVYAGKAGGHYLTDALFDFVAAYRNAGNEVSILVLSTQSAEPFERAAESRNLPVQVTRAAREEMPGYLSAADVGLCFLEPTPSTRARSPIKIGEYLACGLPVVTNAGVGDYAQWVRDRDVGVVIESAKERREFSREVSTLQVLLDREDVGESCRQSAIEFVGLREVLLPRYEAVYRDLLSND